AADQTAAGPTGLAAPFRVENDVIYRGAQGIACDPHDSAGNVLGHGCGFVALDFVDREVPKLADVFWRSTLVETPGQPQQRGGGTDQWIDRGKVEGLVDGGVGARAHGIADRRTIATRETLVELVAARRRGATEKVLVQRQRAEIGLVARVAAHG